MLLLGHIWVLNMANNLLFSPQSPDCASNGLKATVLMGTAFHFLLCLYLFHYIFPLKWIILPSKIVKRMRM